LCAYYSTAAVQTIAVFAELAVDAQDLHRTFTYRAVWCRGYTAVLFRRGSVGALDSPICLVGFPQSFQTTA